MMSTVSSLNLLTMVVLLGVGFFVFGSNWHKETNRTFFWFALLLAWLCFARLQVSLSQTAESAQRWVRLQSVWPFALLAQTWLVLLFTGHEKVAHRPPVRVALTGSVVLFTLVNLVFLRGTMTQSPTGWMEVYSDSTNALFLATGAIPLPLTIFLLWLLVVFGRRIQQRRLRTQAALLGLGVALPTFMGVIVEIMLPSLFSIWLPDLTTWSFLVTALVFALAIMREGLFEVTVAQSAEDLFTFLPDAIFLSNVDGGIIRMNPAAVRLLGPGATETTGRNLFEILTIERGSSLDLRSAVVSLRTNQGELIPVSVSTAHAKSILRPSRGLLYTVRDERERIAMEQAVAESEKRYRQLFDATPLGMYRTSLDGRLLECNPAMLRWLGLRSIEEIGKVKIADHYVDPSQRVALIQKVKETGVVRGFEAQFRTPDGAIHWVAIDLVRSPLQKDVLEGTIQDITPRKTAEQERARLEEELQASRMREAVAQLAAGIAHDFNNILTVINIYAVALARDAVPESRQDQISSKILTACARAVALADRLLKSGEAEVRPTRVELNAIVRDNISGLRTLGGSLIPVREELADGDLFLEADPDQIQWSLLQLAANSVEAMPQGGTLLVRTGALDRFAFISVADTGAGMDEETQEKLFEPYFTTKGFGTGAGHGLSRLHRIVTAHGGKIDVKSKIGEGTTVTLLLPKNR